MHISTISQMIWPSRLVVLDRQGLAISSTKRWTSITNPPLVSWSDKPTTVDTCPRCLSPLCQEALWWAYYTNCTIYQRLRFICIEWKSLAFAGTFSQILFELRFECPNVRTKKHLSFVVFVVVCRLLKMLNPCGFCDQIQDADSTDECMVHPWSDAAVRWSQWSLLHICVLTCQWSTHFVDIIAWTWTGIL